MTAVGAVFASDHGHRLASRPVPSHRQMVANPAAGGAAINVLSRGRAPTSR
jgi:hypothetical protein